MLTDMTRVFTLDYFWWKSFLNFFFPMFISYVNFKFGSIQIILCQNYSFFCQPEAIGQKSGNLDLIFFNIMLFAICYLLYIICNGRFSIEIQIHG